jgi:hypothetical protein
MTRFVPGLVLLAVTVTGVVSLTASATTVIAETLEDMAVRAPIVVRATARQSQAAWSGDNRRIWTWTELVITERLKGSVAVSVNSTLLVKQPGGEVGKVGQGVAGVASFTPGEDCLLFLEPSTDEPGTYVVRGLAAGKISVVERQGRAVAVRDLSGLAFARPGPTDRVRVLQPETELGAPELLVARLRRAIGGAR